MKRHGQGWWIGWSVGGVVIALPIAYVVYFIAWAWIISPHKAQEARQHIQQAEPQALLAACRDMIAHREQYRNDWPDTGGTADGDRALQHDMGGFGEDVPKIIRDMNPWHIVVSKHRVLVFVHGPPRTGFIGYAEGSEERTMLQDNRYTMLTNGLWMFTH